MMKLFACTHCRQVVFFESVSCIACGHRLAYLPDANTVSAMVPEPTENESTVVYRALAVVSPTVRYRLCENGVQHGVCNWAVPTHEDTALCFACRLNQTIPDLSQPGASQAWGRLEIAKHRVVYGLRELGLPIASRHADEAGLAFVFAADQSGQRVLTGHDHGVITINVAEADDPFREKIREQMGEPYRTLLGHFRHELGHYYWDRLVQPSSSWLARFRELFGDERADYGEALQHHYDQGPPHDWSSRFISAYASMHPWEDWAETFAHYLHMVDTLDTARSYGLALRPAPLGRAPLETTSARAVDFGSFDDLVRAWVPLTLALNSMNRGMGMADVYPFVLSAAAIDKLRCMHELVQETADQRCAA